MSLTRLPDSLHLGFPCGPMRLLIESSSFLLCSLTGDLIPIAAFRSDPMMMSCFGGMSLIKSETFVLMCVSISSVEYYHAMGS